MLVYIMFIIYILISIYFLKRLLHWLKLVSGMFKHKRVQTLIIVLYLFLASTILFGGLMPKCGFKIFMQKIGNYWLGTFNYLVFFMIVVDIIVAVMKLINRKHEIKMLTNIRCFYSAGVIVAAASITFSVCGFVHAHKLVTTTYDVTVDKEVDNMSDLKIALVSDLHMGYSDGCSQMKDMVDKINALNPDVVAIAGDIFDNNYDALEDPDELIRILGSIKSKYGVYATYGNHDVTETLIGGFSISSKRLAFRDPRMDEFLKKCGFKVLEDDAVLIDGKVNLIGRLDGEKAGDGTSDRKSIEELTKSTDKTKPVIVIQHEPSNLDGISKCGVDVLLSGHTHAGQFFPLTVGQPFAWENYYGLLKKGNMYSVLTSGVGLYGPNMRTLTTAEVVELNIHFK